MKIAFFIPHVTRKPGFENNVSAHVQLPCEIAGRLRRQGHQVEILTDSLVDGYTLPVCLPEGIRIVPMVGIAFVTNADRAPFLKVISSVFIFVKMAFRIKKTIVQEQYDVIHFYGTERILLLSKLVSLFRVRTSMVLTFNQCIRGTLYEKIRKSPWFWKQLKTVVVSMEQMKSSIPNSINVNVIHHGIIKDLSAALEKEGKTGARKRVLFWRTPDRLNGGDICIEVFRKLASQYPDIDFDLAIRAESTVADLEAYEREVPNGHVFRFPYPENVTLESLLADSICIFQPFREYTYHPQFVILESLMLGLPVVASNLPGIGEMVQAGENGYIFPLDNLELAEKGICRVLDGEIQAPAIIREKTNCTWSWSGYEEQLITLYSKFIRS